MVKGLKYIAGLLMFSVLFTAQVHAADIYTEGYLEYYLKDNSISICGYFGSENEVTVPASIAGYPVSEIEAGAFSDAETVTKVNLPDTIMRIEEGAFAGNQRVIYDSNTSNPTVDVPNDVDIPDQNASNDAEIPGNDEQSNSEGNPGSKEYANRGESDDKAENKKETDTQGNTDRTAEENTPEDKTETENTGKDAEKKAGDEETEVILEEPEEQKNDTGNSAKVWIIAGALGMLIIVAVVVGAKYRKQFKI